MTRRDTIGLATGINTYAYVGGNLVGNIDLDGRNWQGMALNIGVGAISGYLGANQDPCASTETKGAGGHRRGGAIAGKAGAAGTLAGSSANAGLAGLTGNSVGQIVANKGFSNFSFKQAYVQGIVSLVGGVTANASGLWTTFRYWNMGWNAAQSAEYGAAVGSTIGLLPSTAINAVLPSSVGGFGKSSATTCTCPKS